MTYNILDYNAVPDGKTVCTKALQKALDDAAKTGGTVVVPAGVFLSGSLRIGSNTELYLSHGAVLRCSLREEDMIDFSKDFEDDNEDTGWEGGCFLYACHAENVTISGTGMIDGRGREVFFDDDPEDGPHEGPLAVKGFRPRLSFLEDIEGLVIKDVTFYDAAFWTLHLAGCRNVRIENIVIDNNKRGVNSDGIDPDSCRNVLIRGCRITAGDDCIVMKTTGPMHRKYGDCRDIIISDCILSTNCTAIKIGTETHGDIHDILVSNCIVRDCIRGFGIWSRDGGDIYGIHVSHVIGNTRNFADCAVRKTGIYTWWGEGEPVFISAAAREGVDRIPGKIRDITLDHLEFDSEAPLVITGEEQSPIDGIRIEDSLFRIKKGEFEETVDTRKYALKGNAGPGKCAAADKCVSGESASYDNNGSGVFALWSGYLDERPSSRGRNEAKLPAVYIRNANDISFS